MRQHDRGNGPAGLRVHEEHAGSRATALCYVQDTLFQEKFYINILAPYSSVGLAIVTVMKIKSQSC